MPKIRRCRYTSCHKMVSYNHYYCEQHRQYEAQYLKDRQRWQPKSKLTEQRYNHITRKSTEAKRTQYSFYSSHQWQSLRRLTLGRDNYLCQYCNVLGIITPDCKTVDHIVPIAYDQKLMDNSINLATICRKCHKLKTDWERQHYFDQDNQVKPNAKEITNLNEVVMAMHTKQSQD